VRRFAFLSLLLVHACGWAICGCAVAFTPGAGETPRPQKFQDHDSSAHHEAETIEEGNAAHVPAFGVSLVVGGNALDAGALPKPPIPVVLLP
jgi:hypothetical protein